MIDYSALITTDLLRAINQYRFANLHDDGTELGWQEACRELIAIGLEEEGF